MRTGLFSTALVAGLAFSSWANAEIKIGFVTSLSGNGAAIGIPYSKGVKAAQTYRGEVGGEKITLIELDDGTDPSAATRNARKLIEEEKVDLIIGAATAPSSSAVMTVAKELKVPMLAVAPVNLQAGDDQWGVVIPQPAMLMASVIADRIKRDNHTNVALIGFSDAWGDLCLAGAQAAETAGKIKLVADERYARTDTSVTGQVLKIMAKKPDAILLGSSATQAALPPLELAKRGYKGSIYGLSPVVSDDFVRVGGKAVEGVKVSIGPVVVAEQLPDDHYAKKLALEFRAAYEKANGSATRDNFSAYGFDAWIVFLNAAERALKTAKPGTQEFRVALKDAILSSKEVSGVHAVYNFNKGSFYGVDDRSLVVVKLVDGVWKYEP